MRPRRDVAGSLRAFTLLELVFMVAMLAVLASMALPRYRSAVLIARNEMAMRELTLLMNEIDLYELREGALPLSLAGIGRAGMLDPWGNAYEYLNLSMVNLPGSTTKTALVTSTASAQKKPGATTLSAGGSLTTSTSSGQAQTSGPSPKPRKDRFLVPINSDYDLYSKGADGESVAPLTAAKSQDDIVRANDGEYLGLASRY